MIKSPSASVRAPGTVAAIVSAWAWMYQWYVYVLITLTHPTYSSCACTLTQTRNPHWFVGQCVVCWAAGKRKLTSRYCRECQADPAWTFKSRKKDSYSRYTPRLCSVACWNRFHSTQVWGLDRHKRKKR